MIKTMYISSSRKYISKNGLLTQVLRPLGESKLTWRTAEPTYIPPSRAVFLPFIDSAINSKFSFDKLT